MKAFAGKGAGFRKRMKKTAIIVNPLHLSPEPRTLVFYPRTLNPEPLYLSPNLEP
jgi:hypothetical protein